MSVFPTWMCTVYTPGVCGDQKLELQMLVDHVEVLGTEPKFSSRPASALNHGVIPPTPKLNCLKLKEKKPLR